MQLGTDVGRTPRQRLGANINRELRERDPLRRPSQFASISIVKRAYCIIYLYYLQLILAKASHEWMLRAAPNMYWNLLSFYL